MRRLPSQAANTPPETYEPRFTYHGFRYVELSGDFETPPECADVFGVVIHSDIPQTGRFECSDPLANRLWSNLTCGDWRPRRTSATRAWTFRCAP